MEHLTWNISVASAPTLMKRCSKCACETFVNSGKFRVNANGRKLDVWLIYRCASCDATWNLTVFERTEPTKIERGLYERFLANDALLAQQYGSDSAFLKRNSATITPDSLELRIDGALPEDSEAEITLVPDVPMDAPVEKVIAQKLGISRSCLRRAEERGVIVSERDMRKVRLCAPVSFTVLGII